MENSKLKGIFTEEEKDKFQSVLQKGHGKLIINEEVPDSAGWVLVHAWAVPSGVRPGILFAHLFERNRHQKKWAYKGPFNIPGSLHRRQDRKEAKSKLLEIVHSTLQ